ncbi:peptidoglycan DD-metalloendopeptidase family protein [Dyella sp.]|jgi:lipoprotein NlpD|uniref:peptidoglycan DD-metalloendopeptidase family protein n=1 Tax=Dyella sp. TaxID=1869338 RepID=UPI002D76CC08|nr:peptidoglycan DD-metalloendopeptidase family protein [Dyella sp.]HET6433501.1 peptidoglycan DD-metalloendopeptidase family protein [Dyella sp.]
MLNGMKGTCYAATIVAVAFAISACGTRRSVVIQPASGRPARAVDHPVRNVGTSGIYRVSKGDTLYSIAFRHGQDFRDVARWNSIAPPYTIWPGQQLVLHAPTVSRAAAPVASVRPPARPPAARPPAIPEPRPAVAVAVPAPAAPAAVVDNVPVAGVPPAVPPPPPPAAPVPAAGGSRSIGGVSWRWPADGSLVKGFRSGDAIPGIEIGGASGSPVRAAADGVVVYSGNGLVGYGELVIVKHSDDFLSAYGHNRKRLVKEGQRVTAGQQIAEMGSTGAARDELQFQIRRNGNPVNPLDYLPPR